MEAQCDELRVLTPHHFPHWNTPLGKACQHPWRSLGQEQLPGRLSFIAHQLTVAPFSLIFVRVRAPRREPGRGGIRAVAAKRRSSGFSRTTGAIHNDRYNRGVKSKCGKGYARAKASGFLRFKDRHHHGLLTQIALGRRDRKHGGIVKALPRQQDWHDSTPSRRT